MTAIVGLVGSPVKAMVLAIFAISLALVSAWPATLDLVDNWIVNEAYSHGFLLIAVACFLGYQNLRKQNEQPVASLWFLPIAVASLFILVIAHISELHVVAHYGLFGFLVAMVLGSSGWQGLRNQFIPLTLVFLAIPIPGYFQFSVTSELKLYSSELGGALLHQLRVPVFIQGNIIDLGRYQLHVADACSGLNYLVPLLAIGVMLAGFLRANIWVRIVIVLVTIPLTLLMNVVRIGIAGLLVMHVGPETAEGFIHDFEGWMVFVLSLVFLLGICAVLLRIGPNPSTLKESLLIEFRNPGKPHVASGALRNLLFCTVLALAALLVSTGFKNKEKFVPHRADFASFPMLIDRWIGSPGLLDAESILTLKLSDYVFASYASGTGESVDVLATWYAVQTDGATPHSPEVCLPGAGWEIESLERFEVDVGNGASAPLNRAVLQRRGQRMLAYYWFQQRGRIFADEFLMKWYIVQDAVIENRVDGGMVRLTTLLDGPAAEGDQRLQDFMTTIWPILPRYLPE